VCRYNALCWLPLRSRLFEIRARTLKRPVRWLAAGGILAAASWAGYAAVQWLSYGRAKRADEGCESDALLDLFMPHYEVAETHSVRVNAAAEITFAAAATLDLQQSGVIRAIFNSREWILGSKPEEVSLPRPLLEWAETLGWVMLAKVSGREVIFGAVTQPWQADVLFRAIPRAEFANFNEPGYAKIVWTLRADPTAEMTSIASTETRVLTTSPTARAKFRRYWAWLSPGIILIRRVALRMVKGEAERRAGRAGCAKS
jgi:hypothetical protein